MCARLSVCARPSIHPSASVMVPCSNAKYLHLGVREVSKGNKITFGFWGNGNDLESPTGSAANVINTFPVMAGTDTNPWRHLVFVYQHSPDRLRKVYMDTNLGQTMAMRGRDHSGMRRVT